jgi:hypothetical protein
MIKLSEGRIKQIKLMRKHIELNKLIPLEFENLLFLATQLMIESKLLPLRSNKFIFINLDDLIN